MKYEQEYIKYLKKERKMASASMSAYCSDIDEFLKLVEKRGKEPEDAGSAEVSSYLNRLKDKGKSASTVNRKLASVRAYYAFLRAEGYSQADPTDGIRAPRIEKREIEFLSVEEMEKLLSAPDGSDKGIRDRAMIELMYATGLRANEITEIKTYDINLQIGFISVFGENGKARMIPVGRPARAALKMYLEKIRPVYVKDVKEDKGTLFVNYLGEPLTRQGVWKILKYYGQKAKIEQQINPQVIRNSFAAHMVQNGADLKSLQELMGYEDIMATKIFASLTKNRIMDVYDRTHPRA